MAQLLWPGGMQTVLTTLGMSNLNNQTFNISANAFEGTFLASPVQSLVSLVGNGDFSTLFTRFVQFGALGSILQFLGISEMMRWAWYSLYDYILGRFVLRVYFDGEELPYMWLMLWLSKQKQWTKSRDIQVTSQNFGLGSTIATLVPGEDTKGKEGQRLLTTIPWNDATSTMWFRRRLMRVTRQRQAMNPIGRQDATLTLTLYTRKHQIMYDLLLEAKKLYESELETRVVVYNLDQWNNWLYCGSRPKRSMTSVIIAEETKDLLLEDCKDFMDSEEWYGQRGIPWQRGWLLYGAPGSGKTSTIQALAGELGLHIYVVSLSKRGMDDTSLNTLINAIPPRSMILMEDIDAAFTRSVTREAPAAGSGPIGMGMGPTPDQTAPSSVTLSGLLNAIDGVQAQQGRLLFATTNKYDALDPALVRPGRLDLHIEFTLASKWQATELFRRFYPVEKAERSSSLLNPVASTHHHSTALDSAAPASADEKPTEPLLVDEPEDLGDVQRIRATGLKQNQRGRKAPRLTQQELESLAREFSDAIPDEELSMAAIQGHLMMHKIRPHEAVRSARLFVTNERERLVKAKQITKEQAAEREKASDEAEEVIKNSKVGAIATVDDVSSDQPISNPVTHSPAMEYSKSKTTFTVEGDAGSHTETPSIASAETPDLTESTVIVDA